MYLTDKQIDKQTDRQTDRQTGRQAGRQTLTDEQHIQYNTAQVAYMPPLVSNRSFKRLGISAMPSLGVLYLLPPREVSLFIAIEVAAFRLLYDIEYPLPSTT